MEPRFTLRLPDGDALACDVPKQFKAVFRGSPVLVTRQPYQGDTILVGARKPDVRFTLSDLPPDWRPPLDLGGVVLPSDSLAALVAAFESQLVDLDRQGLVLAAE